MTKETLLNIVAELTKIKQSEWWKIVKKDLQETINILEEDIFEINPDGNKLEYTANDLLKLERTLRKQLLEIVDILLDKYNTELEVR
jgi:predicted metal-dependent hydrolase